MRFVPPVQRMIGVAISGGDFRKSMHTKYYPDGLEMLGGRSHMLIAARAAGVHCFDTVFTNLTMKKVSVQR